MRARLAHELLDSWRQPPGLREDGAVDAEKVRAWLNRARELAAARGRGVAGDHHVGQVFIYYPQGADGAWPHEAVRDLLEEVASEHIERGISTEIFNRQGAGSRAIGAGGVQERATAERYYTYARLLSDGWPRTARLMTAIAHDYDAVAKHEDTQDELQEDLWR